jgi:hypothetical protein
MLFIVRGKNSNHDRSLRIHAESAQEAEAIGFKRGLFVTEVTPVETSRSGKLDQIAEVVRQAWQKTHIPPLKAFGRAISNGQAAALVLCGALTWAIDLHKLVFI